MSKPDTDRRSRQAKHKDATSYLPPDAGLYSTAGAEIYAQQLYEAVYQFRHEQQQGGYVDGAHTAVLAMGHLIEVANAIARYSGVDNLRGVELLASLVGLVSDYKEED